MRPRPRSTPRASTAIRWADEAGFTDFATAPIENDFWRCCLMRG
ncbi:hypothetical protein [Glycomyces sp. L485]|nr:hypothetical protein [Glycomyces sp. L485]